MPGLIGTHMAEANAKKTLQVAGGGGSKKRETNPRTQDLEDRAT
jgi:hypothetical protein